MIRVPMRLGGPCHPQTSSTTQTSICTHSLFYMKWLRVKAQVSRRSAIKACASTLQTGCLAFALFEGAALESSAFFTCASDNDPAADPLLTPRTRWLNSGPAGQPKLASNSKSCMSAWKAASSSVCLLLA